MGSEGDVLCLTFETSKMEVNKRRGRWNCDSRRLVVWHDYGVLRRSNASSLKVGKELKMGRSRSLLPNYLFYS